MKTMVSRGSNIPERCVITFGHDKGPILTDGLCVFLATTASWHRDTDVMTSKGYKKLQDSMYASLFVSSAIGNLGCTAGGKGPKEKKNSGLCKGAKADRSGASAIRIFPRVRVQRFGSIVAYRFDDTQSFRPSLPEQYPITHRQILWPLHEAERHCCPIACPDKGSVDVDDGARLADGAHVQHGLILGFDGGRVRKDQDFGDELPVDFGRGVEFGEDDHAFADFFSAYPFQSEGGRLTGAAHGDGDAFPFD